MKKRKSTYETSKGAQFILERYEGFSPSKLAQITDYRLNGTPLHQANNSAIALNNMLP